MLAYWRFEGGQPGQSLTDVIHHKGQPAVKDTSGSGNHLYRRVVGLSSLIFRAGGIVDRTGHGGTQSEQSGRFATSARGRLRPQPGNRSAW